MFAYQLKMATKSLKRNPVLSILLVLGIALGIGLTLLVPPDLPLVIVPVRLAILAVATVVVAVLGALGTLRRILRIDPADAIG